MASRGLYLLQVFHLEHPLSSQGLVFICSERNPARKWSIHLKLMCFWWAWVRVNCLCHRFRTPSSISRENLDGLTWTCVIIVAVSLLKIKGKLAVDVIHCDIYPNDTFSERWFLINCTGKSACQDTLKPYFMVIIAQLEMQRKQLNVFTWPEES